MRERVRGAGSRFALLVGLLLTAALAAAPGIASAEYLHGPVNFEFGPTGGAGSFSSINTLAYQQATHRLYVLGDSAINGYDNPSPGTFTPLGGNFPIAVGSDSNDSDIAVDNSGGASAGHVFWGPDGREINGWDSSGNALPGFPIDTELENCGIAVDNEGHIWGGRYGNGSAAEWGPAGGSLIQAVNVYNAVGNLCKLAIDQSNNDLWVSQYNEGIIAKFPAAGGYSSFSSITGLDDRNNRFAINATRHVLYIGGPNTSVVRAYSTVTGELLESFTISGGTVKGLAVQDSTDTVFVAVSDGEVQELKGLSVPKATTGEPTANTTVSGTADPDGTGEITECFFEFGLTNSGPTPYGSTTPCDQSLPIASTTPVSATLSLIGEKTYHYRLVLGNANGRNHGADKTITPHNVKGLETGETTDITRTEATLQAHYEGDNNETHYHFEWGLSGTAPYEHSTPDEVKPAGLGNTPLSASLTGLAGGTTYHYRIVATNSFGESDGADRTFTTSPAIKHLATNPADEIEPTTALLHGDLDPDGLSTTYYFQYGHTTSYGLTVPAPPGSPVGTTAPGDVALSAEVSDLDPGTAYHYRIVGTNGTGTTVASDDQVFKTPQPPSIESFTSRTVTASSAELVAQINPNEADTEYRFEYGRSPSYGSVAPIPDGTIEPGTTAEEVEVSLSGLESTTYHFRVVAHSKWGTTTTGDQTFNFAAPSCPNAQLRAETGAAFLPDCRAYELVTPPNAANIFLSAEGPYGPNATTPSRLAFTGTFGYIEGTGEPQAQTDLYVSTRHSDGWRTRYVGLSGSQKNTSAGPPMEPGETIETAGSFERTNGIPANLDMSEFLVWDPGVPFGFEGGGDPQGSDAPYVLDAEGAILGRLPSNVGQVQNGEADVTEGGYVGDGMPSADFSHYVFSSREVAFSSDGLTASPGSVYDDDVATGTVTKVSETSQNTDIPAGTGGPNEWIEIRAVSTNGSHILMSTRGSSNSVHLYMTVDGTHHYDVSVGEDGLNHQTKYVGMSADGSFVYFTSDEQLTADDHDSSRDLYMWTDTSPTTLTRVSTGDGGTGDVDSCNAGWDQGCGAAPISTQFRSDNSIASQSGEIYFYSPEQLDHGRGVLDARNLYVFSQGQVRYLATMPEADPITRIQVSPTGSDLALVTAAKLSASPTGGYREMYVLEPNGGFQCVSCSPSGAPAFDVEGSKNGLFMTDDGRAFFSTAQSLVNQDTDAIVDTYEFVDNRPQLISSGTAAHPEGTFYPNAEDTGLIGVSADGLDAYFATRDTMVEQDTTGPFLKFYDARSNGGLPFQLPAAPCAAADECHGPASTAPAKIPSSTGEPLGSGGNHTVVGGKKKKKNHPRSKRRHRTHGHGHRKEAGNRG